MREFCLQRARVLFAACNSFACSEVIFLQFLSCLQRAGVLFAVCNPFACSVHFFYSKVLFLFAVCGSFVCSVQFFCLWCVYFF